MDNRPRLAQLDKRRSAGREVAGFKPRPDQHSGPLNNWDCEDICKRLDFLVFSDKNDKL